MALVCGRAHAAVSCAILVLLQSSGIGFAAIEVRIPPSIDAVQQGYAQLNGSNVVIVKPCAIGKHFTIDPNGASLGSVTVNISSQTYQQYPASLNHIWVELTDPNNIGAPATADVGKVDLYVPQPYDTRLEYSQITGTWGTYGGATMYAGTIDSIISTASDFVGTISAGSGGISWIAAQGTGVVRANITSSGTITRISGAGGIAGNITRSGGSIGSVESGGAIAGNITAGSVGKIITSSTTNGDLTGTVNVSGTINNLSIAGAVSGNISAGTLYIGKGSTGNVRSTAGTVTVSSNLYVGESYAGTYALAGGSLTGAATMAVATTGTFTGRGTVGLTGSLTNNGKVTADGNNADATLSLASFSSVLNGTENTDGLGWFATNTGKLILPDLAITESNATYNWGESEGDADIDLVNSMQVTPAGATAGNLQISLLAPDRSEAALAALRSLGYQPCDLISDREPVIGVWELTGIANGVVQPIPFDAANVTVRYDHAGYIQPFYGVGDDDHPEWTLVLAEGVKVSGQWVWTTLAQATQDGAATHHIAAPVDFSESGAVGGSDAIYLAVLQPLPGDIYLTGSVDGDDMAALAYAWLQGPGDLQWYAPADINGSGYVDGDDLAILAYYWLTSVEDWCVGGSSQSLIADRQIDDEFAQPDDERTASLYAALEQVGLLEAYLDYLSTHQQTPR